MTHFADGYTGDILDETPHEHRTLCGETWDVVILRTDVRADCVRCQDVWADRTGRAFPLPPLVAKDTE